jgi:hypothetical protein
MYNIKHIGIEFQIHSTLYHFHSLSFLVKTVLALLIHKIKSLFSSCMPFSWENRRLIKCIIQYYF